MLNESEKLDIIQRVQEKQSFYDHLEMRPLEVQIYFASPAAIQKHVNLDGILAYHSLAEIIGKDFANLCSEQDEKNMIFDHALPIKQINDGLYKYYACSFALFSKNREFITRWKKRWDETNDNYVDFGGRKQRVEHKCAHFKAFDMPLVVRDVDRIRFCAVANQFELERLLQKVQFIGKKRSQGYGEVKKIEVYEAERDWSLWHSDGIPSRAIPLQSQDILSIFQRKEVVTFSANSMAYRPPYWHKKNYAFCHKMPAYTESYRGIEFSRE